MRTKFLHSFIIFVLILTGISYAQTKTKQPSGKNIDSPAKSALVTISKTIDYKDGREIFKFCKINPEINYKDSSEYYWYNEYSGVKSTKGGSGGNLLHGKYQRYDENGNLKVEANYYLGLEDGLRRTWDEEGNIKETLKFNKGTVVYMKFKNEDGVYIEWIGEMFKKGSVKNVYTSFNVLVENTTFIESYKMHVKTYYENSISKQLEKEFTQWVGDFYEGSYKEYYKNGKPRVVGNFVENFRDGFWTYFNEDGNIIKNIKFRIHNETYPNKKLKIKGSQFYDNTSQDWIRDGKWVYYKENGEDFEKIEKYKNGVLLEGK